MRILFFSDWRIQPMEWIDRMLDEAGDIDFIVYGGDDTRRFAPRIAWPRDVLEKADQISRRKRKYATAVAAMGKVLGRDPIGVPEEIAWLPLTPYRILRFFEPADGSYFQRLAQRAQRGVGAVIGNDCMPEDRYILSGSNVYNLHDHPVKIGDWGYVGIEGNIVSTDRDGRLVNTVGLIHHKDSEVRGLLERGVKELGVDDRHLIIVSHSPPRGSLDLALRFGVSHLGSPALAEFIRERSPALVLCGHAHSQGGHSCFIGGTLVVNGASSDNNPKEARGALIELADGKSPILRWLEPAKGSTTAVFGVGPVSERKLASAGIKTANDLYSASIAEMIEAGIKPATAARLAAKGIAFRNGAPVWLESRHEHIPATAVLYDVETGLAPGRFDPSRFDLETGLPTEDLGQEPWLIAATADASDDLINQWESLDEDRASRRRMLQEFLDFVEANGSTTCAWSGTGFDDRAILASLKRWYPQGLSRWERVTKFDLCGIMKRALELPGSWSIKDVSRFLGWEGPEEEWDGFQAGIAYEAYRQLGDPFDVEGVKQYNRLDVEQLAFTYRWYAAEVCSEDAERRDTTNTPRARWTVAAVTMLEAQLALGRSAYEIELPGYTIRQKISKIAALKARQRRQEAGAG